MGLERIAAVLQGVHSNYDIDLFRALIAASVELTGRAAKGEDRFSHRVIADHLRSSSFLIADGVSPSNEGRGYVLRRIMRRAMRHAHLLGAEEPLMHRLVPVLVERDGRAPIPSCARAQPVIVETLRQEEERFRRTLGRGMALLEEATARLKAGDVLAGETAFKLYDTYGFPLDLTEDAMRAKGLQRRPRRLRCGDGAPAADGARELGGLRPDGAGCGLAGAARPASARPSSRGYDHVEDAGELLALVKDGGEVEAAEAGETVQALFDRTPFYAESGGQAGDRGERDLAGRPGRGARYAERRPATCTCTC